MTFPTIPTTAANTLIPSVLGTAGTTHTFGSLTTLDNASGDLLIAVIVLYQASGTANAFSSWGGGFTEFGDSASATNPSMAMGCAYKISNGTETGTFTVTSSISGRSAMLLMSIKNWHGTTPPEVAFSAATTATAQDPPNLDPTGWAAEDTLWIAVAAGGQTSLTGTWTGIASAPTSYTDYAESTISGGDVIGACQIAVAFRGVNASAEDPGAFTTDTSPEIERAATIAVRPAAALPSEVNDVPGNLTLVAVADALPSNINDVIGSLTINATADLVVNPFVGSVIASADDAQQQGTTAVEVTIADHLNDAADEWMGYRFQSVPIPRASVIASASLKLVITNTDKNDAEGTWYAEAVDHAAAYTAVVNGISGRSRTTASVAWTTNDLGSLGAVVTISGLETLVQEVINRPGWNAGNALNLIYDHNSSTDTLSVASWDNTTYAPAELTILYAVPPSLADTPGTLTVQAVAPTVTPGASQAFDYDRSIDLPGTSGAYVTTADRTALDVSALDTGAYFWLGGVGGVTPAQGAVIQTPHHTDYNIAGDHDWRVEFTVDAGVTSPPVGSEGAAEVMAKHYWGVGHSWFFRYLANGDMQIWFYRGTTATEVSHTGLWTTGHQAHKWWLDVDDGAGGWVMRHYTSDSGTIDGPWTLAHTNSGTGTAGIDTSTVPITLGGRVGGYEPARFKLHAFELRDGNNGTLKAQLRASNYAPVREYRPQDEGFTLVFEDDFPGTSLSAEWVDHYPWFSSPPAGYITVANSLLRIRNVPTSGRPPTDVVSVDRYGGTELYIEARARAYASPYTWPALWTLGADYIDLYPNFETDPSGCAGGARNPEFDIWEPSVERGIGTVLHRNTSSPCSQADESVYFYPPNLGLDLPNPRPDDWHIYAGRISTNYVYTYCDGRLLGTLPAWDTTSQDLKIALSCDYRNASTIAAMGYDPVPPVPDEVWSEWDWVRVWTR